MSSSSEEGSVFPTRAIAEANVKTLSQRATNPLCRVSIATLGTNAATTSVRARCTVPATSHFEACPCGRAVEKEQTDSPVFLSVFAVKLQAVENLWLTRNPVDVKLPPFAAISTKTSFPSVF